MPQPTNTNKSISSLPRGLNSQVVARPTVSFSRRQAATSGLTAQSFAADGSNVTTGEIDPSVLPLASSSTPGIVEPDNTTITVDPATGIITAVGATSTLVVTDGTTTITPTGMITFVGAVVTGTTPNAVVTITGGGSGTVTSVGLSLPAEFTVTGTPVTTSGTLTATWATESANLVFAGPSSGSPATPTFRSLQTADYPNNSVTYAKIQQVASVSLLGNPTGSTANVSGITLGSGLSFSGTTLVATGSGGTVTSVGLSLPSIITVSGSPVTTSGTLTGTLATQTANTVWAGPTTGAASVPTFRGIVAADLPLATTSAFGAVKPDGTSITISAGVISSVSASGANPTATAGPTVINGTATTFMRSDAAPAIQLGSNTQKGLLQVDGTTITATSGVITATYPGSFSGFANPTASIGLTTVNGTATTAMRSNAAPSLSQSISPTWTGSHSFSNPILGAVGTTTLPEYTFTGHTGDGFSWQSTTNGNATSLSNGGTEFFRFGKNTNGFPRLSYGNSINDATSINATLASIVTGGTANNWVLYGEGAVNSNLFTFVAATTSANYQTIKGRGTIASPSQPVTGDFLGNYQFAGQNTTGTLASTTSARFRAIVTETSTFSSTAAGTDLLFGATKIGTGTIVDVMRVSADTGLTISSTVIANSSGVLQPAAFGSETANTFLAAPSGSSGTPTFRTIVAADIPTAFFANPTASIGLTAVNGTATTAMRSDGAPALSQSISPTWSGTHTFNNNIAAQGGITSIITGGAVTWSEFAEGATNNSMAQITTNNAGPSITHAKARGTMASSTVPVTSDQLGTWNFNALTTAGAFSIASTSTSARTRVVLTETGTVSSSALGSQYIFTCCAIGSGTLTSVLTMSPDVGWQFNGGTVLNNNRLLQLRVFTVATLPAAPGDGFTAYVSDATVTTFGLATVGGGTNHVPVYYNSATAAWMTG